MSDEIVAKQRWRHKNTGQIARVMGVVEGYVVARYKGASPWLQHINDFQRNYERAQVYEPTGCKGHAA